MRESPGLSEFFALTRDRVSARKLELSHEPRARKGNRELKLIFAGTSEFAVPSLEALIASPHQLAAVVTQPDRPRGRGRDMRVSPVKQVAVSHSLPVLQPERISDAEAVSRVRAFGRPDAMVVVAYGQKIPSELLEWPETGVVNVHGSLLPKYRGAAPIQHALIMGEKQTGVTTMLMDEGWDTGDILLQSVVDIADDETAGELSERLARLGADLLIETLNGLEAGTIQPTPQDDELATLAKSLPRDAGVIDWRSSALSIVNRVRGCTPRPGAFTRLGNTRLKIWRASVYDYDVKCCTPGQILAITDEGITVAAGEGSVALLEIQPESRRRMRADEFARGASVRPGDRFDVRFEMTD